MNLLFLTTGDEKRGSTRYRAYQWIKPMQDRGWDVNWIFARHIRYRKFIDIMKKTRAADIVIIQKKLFVKPILLLLKLLNNEIIFDFDDAIYTRDSFSTRLKSLGNGSRKTVRRLKNVLRISKKVMAGSEALVEYSREFNKNVYLVPTTIVYSEYEHIIRIDSNEVSLGWIGIADNLLYLQKIENVFKRISKKYPKVKLKVIADKDAVIQGVNIENIKWNIGDYKVKLSEISIGIMPLLMDDWSKGKCAFKLIQYMAIGLPVVATNIGANATLITHGHDGFLVSTDDEWVDSLSNLIESKSLRIKMGNAAKIKIKNHFSVESCADNFESVLLSEVS